MTETAYERVVAALYAHVQKVQERGGGRVEANCPAHDDDSPSLSVATSGDGVLLYCHAGCDTRDVAGALGLDMADLFDERSATYRYDDGRTVRRVYDTNGKKRFVQTGATPTSTLYRSGALTASSAGRTVFLVEGEKDVHAVETLGGLATTAPQGADSFAKVDVTPLTDRDVVVVVDRDDAGQKWARAVAGKLDGVARRYRFVRAKAGKDAADHIAAGFGLGDFEAHQVDVPATGPAVELIKANDYEMEGVLWAYRGRIPIGMVTLLAGREGIGKSTVALDIAARLTRGTLPGMYEGRPQPVVLCATEDSWKHTILPRLHAVGADLSLVFNVVVREPDGRRRAIIAPADVARMDAKFRQVRPALMIIDPLMAVLDGKIDTHKQSEVQQALEPLVGMCERRELAVLALIHVNKSTTTDPLNSIMGSKAFATLPRSVLYCLEEDDGQFLMCHAKCNVGPKQPTIGYRLASVQFELDPDKVRPGADPYIQSSRVVWGDEDPRTAGEVMEQKAGGSNQLGEAATAILQIIDNEVGVVTTETLWAKLGEYDKRSVENALVRLTKRGRITRVQRGVYQSLTLTPSAKRV